MEDRNKILDSCTYYYDGIIMRENLKANSPERSGSCHGFRSFFICNRPSLSYFQPKKTPQPRMVFVAEPAEIPIFRVPEAAGRYFDSYRRPVKNPQFFNST